MWLLVCSCTNNSNDNNNSFKNTYNKNNRLLFFINNNDKHAYNNIAIKYCNSYLLVYMYLFIIEIVNLNTKVPFYYTYRLVCKCSLGNSLGGSYVMLTRLILELVYFKCLITRFYTVYQLHQG